MYYIIAFILGLLFGSFYLVVATRLPKNESIVKPDSHCDNCQKKLKWYELIPIFSYLFLKGKCAKCHTKISILNPLIELFTGLLFLLSYILFGLSYELLISIIISSVLVIIFITDFKSYLILDSPIVIGSILLIIINIFNKSFSTTLLIIGQALIVTTVIFLVKIIGDKVFKKESLGGGDIKLMIFVGLLLGIKLGLISFALSAFLALPYALFLIFNKKEKEVPFGPFIITAAFLVFIFQNEIINLLNTLFLLNI